MNSSLATPRRPPQPPPPAASCSPPGVARGGAPSPADQVAGAHPPLTDAELVRLRGDRGLSVQLVRTCPTHGLLPGLLRLGDVVVLGRPRPAYCTRCDAPCSLDLPC